ncbi:hypothetical protein AOB60_25720 [Streptomyces noursei]|uniref:Uncharacterized protein n=1 Tax=Streptomyces noursei TaxID=1971 RepID=A0A2N8P9F7_STRNR|nr:hypothetical protein AOB60_25720 [Streptomyces noursei]
MIRIRRLPLARAVQTGCVGRERGYQFVAPAAHGGVADLVGAGHVGDALVVAEHGEHDDDPSGARRRQRGPIFFRWRLSRSVQYSLVFRDTRRRHW